MQVSGVRLLEVLLIGDQLQRMPGTLDYAQWALRYEEIIVDELRTPLADPGTADVTPSGMLQEAENLLLYNFGEALLYTEAPDPVENPPVPVGIAQTAAEHQAATTLLRNLFLAFFGDADVQESTAGCSQRQRFLTRGAVQ